MDTKLKKDLEELLSKVLDYTIDKLLEMLEFNVDIYVYKPLKPTVYKRTYDFLHSWVVKGSGNIHDLKRCIEHDWQSMRLEPMGVRDYVYHGSMSNGRIIDNRPVLAEWLDEGAAGLNTEDNGSYWDAFLDDAEKYIDTFIMEGFKKYGHNVVVKKVR